MVRVELVSLVEVDRGVNLECVGRCGGRCVLRKGRMEAGCVGTSGRFQIRFLDIEGSRSGGEAGRGNDNLRVFVGFR